MVVINTDLYVPRVQEEVRNEAIKDHSVVDNHVDPLLDQLLEPSEVV